MPRRRRGTDQIGASGVLVIDKPTGVTSHDVVACTRRALDTRSVGHAGTLDPLATGVLVVGFGEGTKLTSYLTSQEKTYDAEIGFGIATTTLDSEGDPIEWGPLPSGLCAGRLRAALSRFLGTHGQRVPEVSAVKVAGQPLHQRIRRGEQVAAPTRPVTLRSAEVRSVRADRVRLRLECGKGFYVRSLARDLAAELGTVGHICQLRRVQSGAFSVAQAVSFDVVRRLASSSAERESDRVPGPLLDYVHSLHHAWPGPLATVGDSAAQDVSHGRPVALENTRLSRSALPNESVGLVHQPEGCSPRLIGIARIEDGYLKVVRGIRQSEGEGR